MRTAPRRTARRAIPAHALIPRNQPYLRTIRVILFAFLSAGTWGLRELLIAVNGAAPFWDAATTVLCLCAQYLLCRKRIENWFFWIAADIIYAPLYLSRGLPLTAILYAGFLILCLVGLHRWRKKLPS